MKLVLDSTCDLPDSYIKKYDIEIVPIFVNIDDQTYLDYYDLKPQEFYNYLRKNKNNLPKTSGTSPKQFFDRISKHRENHSSIFVSTITSKLSTTYQSANIAIKRLKDNNIYLIDSLSGSGGLGLLAISANHLATKGFSDQEVISQVKQLRDKSIVMGYVDDLHNLKTSGRISNMKYWAAKITNSKPVLRVKDGVLAPVTKASGKTKAIKKLIKKLMKFVKQNTDFTDYNIMITHGDDEATAKEILATLEKKISLKEKIINFLTPALSVHLGLGTIVVSLVPSV